VPERFELGDEASGLTFGLAAAEVVAAEVVVQCMIGLTSQASRRETAVTSLEGPAIGKWGYARQRTPSQCITTPVPLAPVTAQMSAEETAASEPRLPGTCGNLGVSHRRASQWAASDSGAGGRPGKLPTTQTSLRESTATPLR
jgi:hypothetical protein